jgi:hypothetical protein
MQGQQYCDSFVLKKVIKNVGWNNFSSNELGAMNYVL